VFAKSTRVLFCLWLLILLIVGGYYACGDDTKPPTPDLGLFDSQVIDSAQVEDGAQDGFGDGFVDAVSTDGPPVLCPKQCDPATASTICISGRALEVGSLLASYQGKGTDPTPVTTQDGAVVKVYDPLEFVADPANAQPLATTSIYNDEGCYIFQGLQIPFSGFFALTLDDADPATADVWTFTGQGVTPTAGVNSTGTVLPAVSTTLATAWGNDLVTEGALIMWIREASNVPVEGVTVTLPSSATDAAVFYFDEDISTSPYFTSGTATTKSGMVAVRKPTVDTYVGTKSGCTVEPHIAGSAANVLFFSNHYVTCP
jgi:hypothetical protein